MNMLILAINTVRPLRREEVTIANKPDNKKSRPIIKIKGKRGIMGYNWFNCKAIIKISGVKGSETQSVGVPLSPLALLMGKEK